MKIKEYEVTDPKRYRGLRLRGQNYGIGDLVKMTEIEFKHFESFVKEVIKKFKKEDK